MGEIVLVPPRERHWTSCERFLIDRTIADLRARGFKASYYEWLTANEVWCSFRLGHRNVIADLGRIGPCVPFGMVGQRRDAKNSRSCLRAQDDGGEMALPRTVRAKHERSPVWSNKSSLADRNSERLAAFALACIAQVSAARSRVTRRSCH
jgi:hypothetical protein